MCARQARWPAVSRLSGAHVSGSSGATGENLLVQVLVVQASLSALNFLIR